MPALPGITAKILTLVEKVLDVFVTVTVGYGDSACNILQFNGTTTLCGDELVSSLSTLVFQLASLGGYMLSALGVVIT